MGLKNQVVSRAGSFWRSEWRICCLAFLCFYWLPGLLGLCLYLHLQTASLQSLHLSSHGWRSLVGCSPWGHEESDMTEWLHFHFSLSCIGEGTGNPLQCSCLENPRDGGAWWAAVYGVAQSWTRLKRLSSSRSSSRWWQDQMKNLG